MNQIKKGFFLDINDDYIEIPEERFKKKSDSFHTNYILNYDDKDLIFYLALKVKGIKESVASAIPAYIEDFQDIFSSKHGLENFKNNKGKLALTVKQISDFDKIVKEYFPKKITDIRKAWTSVLIYDFVKEFDNIDLKNLALNLDYTRFMKN